jgi:hypothetical protein
MIVRCTNCNSAFAVDDVKVEDKKFAFTCPRCSKENVIDNRKQMPAAFSGQAVVDEAFDETDRPSSRKETAVSADREDVFEDVLSTKVPDHTAARDIPGMEDRLLDDSALVDTEDLSGLAEPQQMEEMESSLEGPELPPADDMRSDVPLDDLALDDEIAKLEADDSGLEKDNIFLDDDLGGEKKEDRKTMFEELGEEIGEYKSEPDLILDEMEPREEAGEPVKLEEIDDIDTLLAADEKEKEIIDDFEPLEVEISPAEPKSTSSDMVLDEEIKTEEMFRAEETTEDESITIDLDSLDIDLEDDGKSAEQKKYKDITGPAGAGAPKPSFAVEGASDEDENITIDLESLDIDLQQGGQVSKGESHEELDLDLSDFSEETIQELEDVSHAPKGGDDEDIKLDLESLDISLEESDEIRQGESIDDDEKLTLEDAGLTLEELTTDELTPGSSGPRRKDDDRDENIRLSIDDIDKDLDLQAIEMELKEAESILADTGGERDDLHVMNELPDLPEIDFIEEPAMAVPASGAAALSRKEDDLMKIDDRDRVFPRKGGLQTAIPDMAARGAVNFSIDYSLKYSRAGAVLRLLCLFLIGLIPHFIVFFVYNILSLILGVINHIVVLATQKNVEDFSVIHENTLRYLLSISASASGIIEEMPIYAGRNNIDHPLQMRIIFPLRSSRILAFLRLSGIGILIMTLPHFLFIGLLGLVIPLISIVGLVSVLATGGWPHFLFEFMTRYYRYAARVLAFSIGIVDVYPRFKFD